MSFREKDHFASMLIFQRHDRARRTLSGVSSSSSRYTCRKIILSADLSVPPKWITWTYKHAAGDEKSRTACYVNRVSAWKRCCVVKFASMTLDINLKSIMVSTDASVHSRLRMPQVKETELSVECFFVES